MAAGLARVGDVGVDHARIQWVVVLSYLEQECTTRADALTRLSTLRRREGELGSAARELAAALDLRPGD